MILVMLINQRRHGWAWSKFYTVIQNLGWKTQTNRPLEKLGRWLEDVSRMKLGLVVKILTGLP
jgi:hypothetical protein